MQNVYNNTNKIVEGEFINYTIIDKFFSIAVILLPFLYQYKGIFEQISFGETLLMPFIIFFSLAAVIKEKIHFDVWLLLFYFISIFTTIVNSMFSYFNFIAASTVILRMIFYGFLIFVARKHFDFKYASKIYQIIVLGFSLYLIAQYYYYYSFGIYLPITFSDDWVFTPEAREDLEQYYKFFYRASSLFLEPSYYALFSLPYLCRIIFYKRKIISKISLLLLLTALILSTSGAGIIGSGIILMIYIFQDFQKKSWKSKIFQLGLVGFLGIVISLYIFNSDNAVSLLDRLQSGGSFNQRITRGIILYFDMDIFHNLFGVGLNNLEPYMLYNNLSTPFDEKNLNYSCTLVQTLNYSGIIGFIVLVIYLKKLKNKLVGNDAITLYWIIIFIMSYESILYMYRFAFLIIFLEGLCQYNKNLIAK